MNPTTTLARIRACHPCSSGWTTLLAGLGYADGNYLPERVVSLGDVATINGAADALWCIRALDWSDVSVRRAVIAGAVLSAVTRALKHTTDKRVHDCVDAVKRWCAGDDTVDLQAARKGARAAADAAADAYAYAAAAAAYAAADAAAADAYAYAYAVDALAAADAAAEVKAAAVDALAAAADAAAEVKAAAVDALAAAADALAAAADAAAAERIRQRDNIIAAFACVALLAV